MTANAYQHPHPRGDPRVTQAKCQTCKELHATHDPLPAEGGFMEKLSDLIGSTKGIWLLAAIEAVYMVAATVFAFDPYPFAFLTLVLSLIALQFSQIIIVVQNRQGALLEVKAQMEREQVASDLALDRKAFALLVDLHEKLLPDDDPGQVVALPKDLQDDRNPPAGAGTDG